MATLVETTTWRLEAIENGGDPKHYVTHKLKRHAIKEGIIEMNWWDDDTAHGSCPLAYYESKEE